MFLWPNWNGAACMRRPALPSNHRIERCLPPGEGTTAWPWMAARDQARRLPHLADRDAKAVLLFTRNGDDFANRFPQIVEAIEGLPVRPCFLDGEAIVVDGLLVFDLIRYRQHDHATVSAPSI
jgi:hypothetical protein